MADRSSLAQAASAVACTGPGCRTHENGVRAVLPARKSRPGRNVRVDAPHTAVRVDKDSGKVAVRAPHTDVKVDPDKGQVRVRAPYVNLDIRW